MSVNSVYKPLFAGYNLLNYRKPSKKTDKELWELIDQKIESKAYIFLVHAKQRLRDRNLTDLVVLDILENRNGRKRKRNKSKDTYKPEHRDWNYCIEGNDSDKRKVRIIISFNEELMLIVTVIRIAEKALVNE